LLLAAQHTHADNTPVAYVEQSGAILCSESPDVICELSTAVWIKRGKSGVLVLGNDKPPKSAAEASAFSIPFDGKRLAANPERTHFNFPPFSQVNKLEAMSVTPDGAFAIAMTAFDRYSEGDAALDKFDIMIAWPTAAPDKAHMVAHTQREGVQSSLSLRNRLLRAIQKRYGDKVAYFKVEGAALLPGNRILFGIREAGESYSVFDYRVALIEGRYRINDTHFELDESFEFDLVHDFSDLAKTVGRPIGVSSIEYDPTRKRLYLLTSFEDNKEKRLGAYLWFAPVDAGKIGAPVLLRTTDGPPFEFPHKAEGLAVLPGNRLLIIHDDDRYLTRVRIDSPQGGQLRSRRSNEAPFDLLKICDGPDSCRAPR
jgi:hypothetical protein